MNLNDFSGVDLIVVGTGPGGASVAKDMAKAGKRVLMLEWGPPDDHKSRVYNYLTQLLIPGKSLLLTRQLLAMVRGITTGGSSVFYYGTCFEPPMEMFRKYGVELADDLRRAQAELPIGELKDEMMTPMASRLMDAAQEAGFGWSKLKKFMDQDRWQPEFPFGYYGDPNRVKWTARLFVEEAVANGAVLLNHAKVLRVLVEGEQAVGVEFQRKGETYTVNAERIVLAAGGIGTPVILRQSGIEEAGRNFFFDPLITVCGTIKDVRTQANEIPMSAGLHMQDEGYLMTDMPVKPMTHLLFSAQVLRFDKMFAFGHTARIMIKAKDTLGGYLTDGGGVRKKLIKEDKDKLLHGYENAKKVLKAAGASSIYKTWTFAAHPGGTAKIGEIVDARLQTRFDNLYVCDCSVIPEAWGLPPTMAILSLGKYLGRHLMAQDGVSSSMENRVQPMQAAVQATE